MTPFLLLLLGLLLIFLEFYLPGLIVGSIGLIFVIVSVLLFANQSSSPVAIMIFTAGVIIAIWLLIKYTLQRIPKVKSGFSIYLKGDQEGFRASHYDPSAIGKTGVVISDLKPGGYILVEGKKMQAISQTGYIPQGSEVKVISGQEESVIVIQKEKL